MTVGDRMRERRLQLKMTQDEVAARAGTIKQTIYKYEQNKITNIPSDKIEAIAAALKTTPSDLMGWDEKTDDILHDAARDTVRYKDFQKIDARLNAAGHSAWMSYGKYLLSQPENVQPDAEPLPRPKIIHYLSAPAAGYAAPIEGSDYEMLDLPDGAPENADFCVNVSGKSMMPYLKNGDMVYVKRDSPLQDFDVGVFFLDGDTFIKQICQDSFGNTYLLSANPDMEDANKRVSRNSDSTLICYGKVILPHRLPQPVYRRR